MNQKQIKFCQHFLQFDDLEEAATFAGYKKSSAIALLKKQEIKDFLQTNNFDKIAKSDEIMMCLTNIMRGDEDITETSPKEISVREKLRAAELLGKAYSIFSPKPELSKDTTVLIVGCDEIED